MTQPHDFKRDGSRVTWRKRSGRWFAYVAESAAWHLIGTSHYGFQVTRWPEYPEVAVWWGRWALVCGRGMKEADSAP